MGEHANQPSVSRGPPPSAPSFPELAGVSRDELRRLYELAWAFAFRLTRSRTAADDLTQHAFELLLTTRRWKPDGATDLRRHVLGIVKSDLHHQRTSRARALEAEAESDVAHERGLSVPSPEQAHLAQAGPSRAERKLERLRTRLADQPLALARLALMEEGLTKPAEIALRLAVDAKQVYRAAEATQYHVRKMLEEESNPESEDS